MPSLNRLPIHPARWAPAAGASSHAHQALRDLTPIAAEHHRDRGLCCTSSVTRSAAKLDRSLVGASSGKDEATRENCDETVETASDWTRYHGSMALQDRARVRPSAAWDVRVAV